MFKLLFLTDGIPPYVMGGMQKHSFLVAEHLAKSGVEIELHHVATAAQLRANPLPFSEAAMKNINCIAYEFPNSFKFPGHYIYNSYQLSKQMYTALKDKIHNFDFIYSKGFMAWHLLQHKASIQPKIGVKFHGMNMFLPTKGVKEKLEQYLLRPPAKWIMQKADIVFSYGGKVSETIQKVGIPRTKILEIPTGITPDWLRDKVQAPSTPLRFVFVGRYDTVKGILPLQKAIKASKATFEFHFIGPFDKDKQINDQRVHYHGSIANADDMRRLLDNMDVLLLPSYSEGMPNVILEAMARGLAIIATDVGAVSMLINKEIGILLPEVRADLIQEAMERMVNDKNLSLMKANSRKRVENFTWEKLTSQLLQGIKNATIFE